MTTEDINRFQNFASALELLFWLKARAEKQTRSQKLSLAELAKRGGYKSRAYVGAVFTGKRKLTEESIEAFSKMLGASPMEKKYLSALVRKERGIVDAEKDVAKIKKKLAHRLLRRKVQIRSIDQSAVHPLTCHTFQVYAGLAGAENAKTLDEVSKISGLNHSICKIELDGLIQRACVTEVDGKFFSQEQHLMVDSEQSLDYLKQLFLEDTTQIQKAAKEDFMSKNKLFITYNFGVSEDQVPLLTAKLREVLNNWVEEHIEKIPEKVISLTVAMT